MNTAPTPSLAPFHLKIHDDMLRFMTKKAENLVEGYAGRRSGRRRGNRIKNYLKIN
jgi:hypothetical protein